MRWALLLGAVVLGQASLAQADEQVEVTLAPWDRHDGVERPFRYVLELRSAGAAPIEVLADRRVLRFEVRPTEGRRRYRCRHPAAPGRVAEGRVRTLTPGSAEDASWREWIDLRMYCTGSALRALEAGATITPTYGWPRATRTRWVARRPGAPTREWMGHADLAPLTLAAAPQEALTVRMRGEGASPIDLGLASASARTGGALVLRPSIRAREGTVRLYVRPDAFGFSVRGPLGDVTCAVERGGGSPPPDLFRRVTRRSAARVALDADFFCPAHTFDLAGVYEIAPEVELPHSGEEHGLDAVTGRFRGPAVPIRITHGEGGYLEQIPEPRAPHGG